MTLRKLGIAFGLVVGLVVGLVGQADAQSTDSRTFGDSPPVLALLHCFNTNTGWDRAREVSGMIGGNSGTGNCVVTNYQGTQSALNITAATLVKAGLGRVFKICNPVPGTGAGSVNDAASTGAATTANQIMAIPPSPVCYDLNWPIASGLVVTPGTGQTLVVTYQ